MSIDDQFGAMMRHAREQRSLSQRDLVDLLVDDGIRWDTSGVSRIENGKRQVRLSEAAAIARVLRFDLGALDGMNSASPVAVARADSYRTGYRRALIDTRNAINLLKEQS